MADYVKKARIFLNQLQSSGPTLSQKWKQLQDLLEQLDQNSEMIASVLSNQKNDNQSSQLAVVAGLLQEQDRYLTESVEIFKKLATEFKFQPYLNE
ncbi:unnamed protein product [Albugo candida]|uniref:Uncharacterized protein n=1 Tax=Albugo candida TaxID=65357 RepID=A0A024GQ89_9STRA|nr:unnamed protein product [Albugo candida]|eukprot:CCI48895.1 unnamed protein product [Albugo candida]